MCMYLTDLDGCMVVCATTYSSSLFGTTSLCFSGPLGSSSFWLSPSLLVELISHLINCSINGLFCPLGIIDSLLWMSGSAQVFVVWQESIVVSSNKETFWVTGDPTGLRGKSGKAVFTGNATYISLLFMRLLYHGLTHFFAASKASWQEEEVLTELMVTDNESLSGPLMWQQQTLDWFPNFLLSCLAQFEKASV